MPGPTIEVCKGDTVVVDVENHLLGESKPITNTIIETNIRIKSITLKFYT